jgi:hypothetical protein
MTIDCDRSLAWNADRNPDRKHKENAEPVDFVVDIASNP